MQDPEKDNTAVISPTVMIVCDYPDAAGVWVYLLQQKGFVIVQSDSSQDVLDVWSEAIPDLVVIDTSGGQTDRLDFCRTLRSVTVAPLLLFMPAYVETWILEAYQAGIDECIVKPISPLLFVAKVQAWLRRTWMLPVNGLQAVKASRMELNPARRALVMPNGKIVRLTILEFRLLHLLMSRPGNIFQSTHLVHSIWGASGQGDSALLKNVVYRLRRKIEQDPNRPEIIQTWPGEGYSFQEPHG
jgi:DNA-binding response OmpR family regulator